MVSAGDWQIQIIFTQRTAGTEVYSTRSHSECNALTVRCKLLMHSLLDVSCLSWAYSNQIYLDLRCLSLKGMQL